MYEHDSLEQLTSHASEPGPGPGFRHAHVRSKERGCWWRSRALYKRRPRYRNSLATPPITLMSDPQDDPGVISISSDSDDGDVAPATGPSNANRRGSAKLDTPHALDDASRAQLHAAIATAPEDRVREAFAALVDGVPAITERVFGMLVAVPPLPVAPLNAAAAPNQGAGGRTKPMIPRWRICENCEKEYDAGTVRRATECSYHDGELPPRLGADHETKD